MPLFECSKCGCLDNTAIAGYWWRVNKENKSPLCSECNPEIGKWHNEFEKIPVKDSGYWIAEDGFLYKPEDKIHHTKLIKPL